MADETDGGKAKADARRNAGKNTGRRARHSAQKKEPVTIDVEPVKKAEPRAKKAGTAAAPAPAKSGPTKSAPAKAPSTRTASAKAAPAKAAPTKAASAKAASAKTADAKPTPAKAAPAPKAADTKAPAPESPSPVPTAKDAKPTPAPAPIKAGTNQKPAATAKTPDAGAAKSATPARSVPSAGSKTSSKPGDAPKVAASAAPPARPVTTTAPAPKPVAASSTPAKSGVGAGGLLAAGLVGGVISLGGAWLLGAFENDTADLDALRAQLDGRIAAVESSIPAPTDPAAALTREDVDGAIETALAARPAPAPAEPDPRIATLSDELTATREELAALQASIAEAGEGAADGTALAALAARIADLDGRVGAIAPAPAAADIQAIAEQAATAQSAPLSQRLEAADGRVAAIEGALAPLQQRIGDLDARLATNGETIGTIETSIADIRTTLDTQVAELRQSDNERDQAGKARVAELGSQLGSRIDEAVSTVTATNEEQSAALSAQASTLAAQGERLGALDERMAAMAEQVADTDPERRAATALALANLRTRIDDGEAYETELALVRRTNPKIDLTPLDGNAGSGIPTLAGLSRDLDAAAERIRAAVDPAPQTGTGGLLANLRSVVKVKPLDGEPGQDVDATIGAIRGALAERDLAAADQAWQTLPDAGREASQDWHDKLQARMKAKNFLSEALASLIEETGG